MSENNDEQETVEDNQDENWTPSFQDEGNEDGEKNNENNGTTPPLRRPTRTRIPTREFLKSVAQEELEFPPNFRRKGYVPKTCAFNAIPTTTAPAYYEAMHREDYSLQDKMSDPIAFLAQSDGDTLNYGQAMKTDDKENFKQAMNQEFMDHCKWKNWKILLIEAVPK